MPQLTKLILDAPGQKYHRDSKYIFFYLVNIPLVFLALVDTEVYLVF